MADPERVKRLLDEIAQSKRDFERETLSRRRLLSTLEPPAPADPLDEAIAAQWDRLARYHQEVQRRYTRRFKKPPPRKVAPIVINEDDWRCWHWQLDEYDRPISNLHNALASLREDPALSGIVALDLERNTIMLKAPLPFAHWDSFDDFEMRKLKDADLSGLLDYVQASGLATLTREVLLDAVRLIARENAWVPDNG
jgi:hypothetical protein